jgi:hypothetical protein
MKIDTYTPSQTHTHTYTWSACLNRYFGRLPLNDFILSSQRMRKFTCSNLDLTCTLFYLEDIQICHASQSIYASICDYSRKFEWSSVALQFSSPISDMTDSTRSQSHKINRNESIFDTRTSFHCTVVHFLEIIENSWIGLVLARFHDVIIDGCISSDDDLYCCCSSNLTNSLRLTSTIITIVILWSMLTYFFYDRRKKKLRIKQQ